MEDLTILEWMEKYPYLKDMSEFTLFRSKEEVEQLKNSEKIEIESNKISIEFLKKILSDDFYFEYAFRYFNGSINRFNISYIICGDTCGNISYDKTIIIKGITKLLKDKLLELQPDEQKRYELLKSSITFDKFLEKYGEDNCNFDIDGDSYSFSIKQLIRLLQLPDEQFDNLCSNKEIKEIDGFPKEYVFYAAYKFLNEINATNEFLIPDNIIKHYNEIKSFEKIDLEAINRFVKTSDTKYQLVKIDEDLEYKILDGMPEDATDLEKAIYIYIKMCKLLTYDEEYYAVNQKGVATEKHKNISYVSSITLENNKVVCFEFNLIYSKLLNKLGIHFCSDYKGMCGEAYGLGHANLQFRADKFLVNADSVTTILQGDIMQAKLNQPLVGLKCVNRNKETQQEFSDAITRMYKLIAEQESSLDKDIEHIQSLEELLEEYSYLTENIENVSLNERLSILIHKVNSKRMIGIDSLSYVLQLKKILFTEEQIKNNIVITIIRNNEPFEEGRIAMASVIIAINSVSFKENPDQTVYYYFNPNCELISITREELQSKFDNSIFEYIEKDNPRIPGIFENGGMKKCSIV